MKTGAEILISLICSVIQVLWEKETESLWLSFSLPELTLPSAKNAIKTKNKNFNLLRAPKRANVNQEENKFFFFFAKKNSFKISIKINIKFWNQERI